MPDSYDRAMGAWDPNLAGLVEMARQDAEGRTGVAAAAWRVVSAEGKTWSDGSLGLPKPGYVYTMALVPGYRLTLTDGVKTLRYHTNRGTAVVFAGEGLAHNPPAASGMGL